MVVLAAESGAAGLLIAALGLAALALAGAGAWWALAHRGAVRVAGGVLAVGAPLAVVVLYARAGLWPVSLAALLLLAAATACGQAAVRRVEAPSGMPARACAPPRHPVLIMNPKSGGGKVGRFGLVGKAEALGARVVLLDTTVETDVAELARRAVAGGADLLGVAGGDGTIAQVAEVAAEHGLLFLALPAGTRNHFAMDLGLDRDDPSRALKALTEGEELRVDLGTAGGRAFVNTVSFGVYAQIVQRPEYRGAKTGTILAALPDLLLGYTGHPLDASAGTTRLESQQALLISNNPYTLPGPTGAGGRRLRLDLGVLGVVGVRVGSAAAAAELAVLGTRADGLHVLTAPEVTVGSAAPTIPVAVDGEALHLPTPVTCTVRPGALRVLVPVHRPGTRAAAPAAGWRAVVGLALGRHAPESAG
ncbi:hypothetical protein KNE206_04130 [Kitasatospora sp. NE20-6]|uniref:diacylglycerol/lipid kinase family protein n=1 Tax=Kitasatospora sp. NE20-6 TaxID=2859066 RepID=UPI0034DC17E8